MNNRFTVTLDRYAKRAVNVKAPVQILSYKYNIQFLYAKMRGRGPYKCVQKSLKCRLSRRVRDDRVRAVTGNVSGTYRNLVGSMEIASIVIR